MIFTWLKLVMVVTAAVVIQQLHWTVSDIADDCVDDDGGDEGDDVDDSSHPRALLYSALCTVVLLIIWGQLVCSC